MGGAAWREEVRTCRTNNGRFVTLGRARAKQLWGRTQSSKKTLASKHVHLLSSSRRAPLARVPDARLPPRARAGRARARRAPALPLPGRHTRAYTMDPTVLPPGRPSSKGLVQDLPPAGGFKKPVGFPATA